MSKQPGVKFIYIFCHDLLAMRRFYTNLLGLDEIYFKGDPDGAVAYNCDGLQFTIISDPTAAAPPTGWAWQPGWQGGNQPVMSWSIPLTDAGFHTAVQELRKARIETYYEEPQWLNYWSFPVKDPMGYTIEVVLPLEEEPASTTWDKQ